MSSALAEELLPENEAPPCVVEAAVELEGVQHFAPNHDGPAARREPSAKDDDARVEEGASTLEEGVDSASQDAGVTETGGDAGASASAAEHGMSERLG